MRIAIKIIGERGEERWRSLPAGRKLLPRTGEENADAMLMETLSSLSIKLYHHHRAAANDTAPKRRNSVGKPLYNPRNFVATTHG